MERADRVNEALLVLPRSLREALLSRSREERNGWEEIRLRAGRGLFVADEKGREGQVTGPNGRPIPVGEETLRSVLEIATRASLQCAGGKLAGGFLPLPGGHRLGVAGSAALREGRVLAFQQLSSLALRIACPVEGAGAGVLPRLMAGGAFQSTVLLSPPGAGKTTLLRDLIRLLGEAGVRTGLADERGEVAALRGGVPQLDVGPLADVMEGCGKEEGLLMLLRSMAPQVLAMDEITAPGDASALLCAAGCGVKLLATAHAGSLEEFRRRQVSRPLAEQKVFRYAVLLSRSGGERQYRVEELG